MRVLNVTTYDEECGVAKFQHNVQDAFEKIGGIDSVIYPTSLNHIKKLDKKKRLATINHIVTEAGKFDIIHIQHEFGLFFDSGIGFDEIISELKRSGAKVVVTLHTAPSHVLVQNRRMPIYRVKSTLRYMLRNVLNRQRKRQLLDPLKKADMVTTLNRNTGKELIDIVGLGSEQVFSTIHPVKNREISAPNQSLRSFFDGRDSIILVVNGFVNPYKGFDKAIKCLKFLPDKYKLLIAGGVNPDSGDSKYMDKLCDTIVELGLTDRIHITGYVKDDEELESLIAGCDIALYPYDVSYYKLASSGAVGVAISNEKKIITFPADSFLEIDDYMSGVIDVTSTSAYVELAQHVIQLGDNGSHSTQIKKFKKENSFENYAKNMLELYVKIV